MTLSAARFLASQDRTPSGPFFSIRARYLFVSTLLWTAALSVCMFAWIGVFQIGMSLSRYLGAP